MIPSTSTDVPNTGDGLILVTRNDAWLFAIAIICLFIVVAMLIAERHALRMRNDEHVSLRELFAGQRRSRKGRRVRVGKVRN